MKLNKKDMRQRRHARSRFYLSGTAQKPRLAVFRSLKHIYAQIIDDETGETIAMASSLDKELRSSIKGGNKEGAKQVGQKVAERAIEKGITCVVFDKGGFKYHGRVRELAEGARSAGLKF
ncbi:MAG: large subunit ribosomal protein [Clostridiales bacterium]|jgi:large subunit ribosomal protein L18|nr:large subunit ribosomal protein [Clostridiales bacterium]MDN5280942.1 large subunit ribosomal protein [Candidatus Ozemobacter sp.]